MKLDEDPKIAAGLAIWMFIIFSAWTSFWSWHAIHISAVAARQQMAQAMVLSLGRWDHGQTYDYSFRVGDKTYTDNSLGPENNAYRKGQFVDVYFDPHNPKTSSLRAISLSASDLASIGFGLAAMIVEVIRWYRTRVATR